MGTIIGVINRLAESNLGGSDFLELIDVENCIAFDIIDHEVKEELVGNLNEKSKVYPIQGSLDFEFPTKKVNGIDLYQSSIKFKLPKHRLDIDRQIAVLKRLRLIAVVHGANGDEIVVGTKDAPLKFTEKAVKYKGGITNRNEYLCDLSVLSPYRPAFYNPDPTLNRRWEDGYLAEWEDGTQVEFENL